MWTKNWQMDNHKFSRLPLLQELREKILMTLQIIYKYDNETSDHLLRPVWPHITKNTVMTKSIPAGYIF